VLAVRLPVALVNNAPVGAENLIRCTDREDVPERTSVLA
jgi:hypothetical protein